MTMNTQNQNNTSETMLPAVGFGTWIGELTEVKLAVKHAIYHGYRLFDCAVLYKNEKEVGAAINECIQEGIVKREDLCIMTKLWNADHAPQDVEPAIVRSLQTMGLEYFDIVMMHWPVHMDATNIHDLKIHHSGDRTKLAKTYAAMEELVHKGISKQLAVANFSSRQLAELLEDCSIAPVANEVERHPYLQQPRLFDYCKQHNIRVFGLSPLGKIDDAPDMLNDPVIQRISEETGKTPAQVILAWGVQSGSTVITKGLTPEIIETNFDVQSDSLILEHMNALNGLDRGYRFVRVPYYDFPDDEVDLSLTQPKAIPGEVDDDNVYRNRFFRAGKVLDSNIIIENGGVRNLKKRAMEYVPEMCHEAKNYLIVDEIVDEVYGDQVLKGFNDGGIETYKIVVPADAVDESGNPSAERHKTLAVFSGCADQILSNGISKNSCIISLGGGVVNNLCGFLASSLYRGITLVHITTSMMGMTDAAIDFKQAVNHKLGKNLLGSYYPATNIVIDPEVLQTLSKRHVLNGIAEALKHALAQSRKMTEAIVKPLSEDLNKALRDPVYLEMVCRECIDHKVPTLIHYNKSDFNEMVPQYGHAVAHAVEHLSFHSKGVSPMLHGEAVSVGMCVTAEVAKILGHCDEKTVQDHYDYISQAGLPVFVPDGLSIDAIQHKLCYDKHYVKKPTMGLLAEVGHMHCEEDGNYSVEVDNDVIRDALLANMARRDAFTGKPRDLYTIDAVNMLNTTSTTSSSESGGKGLLKRAPQDTTSTSPESSTDSSSDSGSDDEGFDSKSKTMTLSWDPMTATSFGPKAFCMHGKEVQYCSCC